MPIPSNIVVRVIYCLCLLLIGRSLLRGFGTLLLLLGSPGNLGLMNTLVAVIPNAASATLLLLVAARFVGVAAGRFKLTTVTKTGPIRALRIVGVCIMAFGVLPFLFALAGVLAYRGADGVGFAFLLAGLDSGTAVGILLFEASRLLEREILLETAAPDYPD